MISTLPVKLTHGKFQTSSMPTCALEHVRVCSHWSCSTCRSTQMAAESLLWVNSGDDHSHYHVLRKLTISESVPPPTCISPHAGIMLEHSAVQSNSKGLHKTDKSGIRVFVSLL